MKKDNLNTILILGAIGIGGYLLYKMFSGSNTATVTGGSYGSGWIPGDVTPVTPINTNPIQTAQPETPITNPIANVTPIPTAPIIEPIVNVTPSNISVTPITTVPNIVKPTITYTQPGQPSITIPAPLGITTTLNTNTQQSWTGATYGQPGQPSVTFLKNTLIAAAKPTATTTTKTAAAAIGAGAPPRIVAKIKAGKVF